MKAGRKLPKLPLKDAWAIWFLLGIVMLNYPFLHIFNKNAQIFGFPLAFLYFFIGWPVSIFVIYLFSLYLKHFPDEDTGQQDSEHIPEGDK